MIRAILDTSLISLARLMHGYSGVGWKSVRKQDVGHVPKIRHNGGYNGVFNRRRFEFRPLRRCNGRYLSWLDVAKPCISREGPQRGVYLVAPTARLVQPPVFLPVRLFLGLEVWQRLCRYRLPTLRSCGRSTAS